MVAPELWAFLTDAVWDDGAPRQPGTLLLVAEDGVLKAWLHDKDGQGRSAWVSGEDLDSLLQACDNAIGSASTAWRPDRPWKGGKGQK